MYFGSGILSYSGRIQSNHDIQHEQIYGIYSLLQEFSWIGHITSQSRCCCSIWGCKIYLALFVSHSPWEVPVCC